MVEPGYRAGRHADLAPLFSVHERVRPHHWDKLTL